jgi:hypothetical protein
MRDSHREEHRLIIHLAQRELRLEIEQALMQNRLALVVTQCMQSGMVRYMKTSASSVGRGAKHVVLAATSVERRVSGYSRV